MALNVTPFVGTDNFNMETFNNMISQINSGVNSEISDVLAQLGAQLGTKAEIVYSSYVGTGTYGSNNPNSLTFDGKPIYVFIMPATMRNYYVELRLLRGITSVRGTDKTTEYNNAVSWTDNGVQWYINGTGSEGYHQFNDLNVTYYYMALLMAE